MKRFLSVLLLAILASSLAWSKASPIQVKHHNKDPRVQRHKAHKARKHKAPKRTHNSA